MRPCTGRRSIESKVHPELESREELGVRIKIRGKNGTEVHVRKIKGAKKKKKGVVHVRVAGRIEVEPTD